MDWLTLAGLSLRWRVAVFAVLGVALGLAIVIARIANAASYLSDSPQTCLNCHVMNHAYATWVHGSHGQVAICNDCHVPHDNVLAKTAFKARDGLRHSYVFTMRLEPQVIRLSEGAVGVVQANCIRCHYRQLAMIRLAGPRERRCWDCHNNIHGSVSSLSAAPNARRPPLPPAGLDWMKSFAPQKGARP